MKFDAKHPITAMWLLLAQELSEKYELSEDLVQIFRTTFYAGGAAVVQLFVEPLLKEKPAEADQPEVVLQILRRIASDVLNGMQQ